VNLENKDKAWVSDLKAILKSKKALYTGGALLLIVLGRAGINLILNRAPEITAPTVNATTPEVRSLDSSLSLPANMEAIEQASLFAHVGGYLKKLYVDEGDKVTAKQLLADIDAPDIVEDYNNRKADFGFKEVTRNRYLELVKEKVISQQEFDSIDAAYNEAKAKFNNAAQNLAYTHITAPFSGSIARRFKYPGDMISVSSKEDQKPIFLLVNESTLRVAVNVPQVEISSINDQDSVDIRVDSFPTETFAGKVSRIDALLDPSTKTERVLIDIENPDNKLRAGMFASVILHFKHRDNAITIPNEAVESVGDKNFVYVNQNSKVKKVPVILGLKQDEYVEVLDGIKPTDHVILKGLVALADGMAVKEKMMEHKEAPVATSGPDQAPEKKINEQPMDPKKEVPDQPPETASAGK
jgi:membrane fusion protein, multidrug efflux system